MTRTINALRCDGFPFHADALEHTRDRGVWERYARGTFLAHAKTYPRGKLRFLQYVTPTSRAWWAARRLAGAILL
jgi:hypothetical protein